MLIFARAASFYGSYDLAAKLSPENRDIFIINFNVLFLFEMISEYTIFSSRFVSLLASPKRILQITNPLYDASAPNSDLIHRHLLLLTRQRKVAIANLLSNRARNISILKEL